MLGARSVTSRGRVVEESVAFTVERWEDALLKSEPARDWGAWAFTVAANRAKKLCQPGRSPRTQDGVDLDSLLVLPVTGNRTPSQSQRVALRRAILRAKRDFIGRQFEVLMKLAEPDMTLHRASRELGMDRHSLRRSFESGVARLSKRK